MQNHPYDPTKIVVYTSLEGDEVGTYTRGTGRLEHGVGRIPLGKTFAWVTNPDIGLTAHVTPRGRFTDLYVESLSSTELVVRSDDGRGQDAVFDYVVMGLRIGFEEASVVRERDVDAYLPSMAPHEEVYRAHPELRSLNALERVRAMREGAGEGRDVDLSQSRALVSAIGVYDAAIHGAPKERLVAGAEVAAVPSDPLKPVSLRQPPPSVPAASELAVETGVAALVPAVVQPLEPKTAPPRRDYELVPAIGGIEPGDVVVLDPLGNGAVAASRTPADPLVVGCADAGEAHASARRT